MLFWGGLAGSAAVVAALVAVAGADAGLVAALVLLVAAWRAPRRHAQARIGGWGWARLAAVALAMAWTLLAITSLVTGAPTSTVVSSGFALVAYLAIGGWLASLLRARIASTRVEARLDAVLAAVALTALTVDALLHPPDWAPAATAVSPAAMALPLVLAAGAGVAVRLVLADAARLPAAWLLLATLLVSLVGEVLIALHPTVPQTALTALAVSPLLLAGALWHPSTATLARPQAALVAPSASAARLVIALLALVVPAVLFARHAPGEPTTLLPLTAGIVAVAVVPWRLALAVRHRQRELAEAEAHARRQAALARLSTIALDARTEHDLLAATAEVVSEALDAHVRLVPLRPTAETAPTGGPEHANGQRPRPPAGLAPVGQDAPPLLAREAITERTALEVVDRADDADPGRPLTSAEREALEAAADLARTSIERLRAEVELRHQSLHDPLTGLPNRSLVRDRLAQALRGATRTDAPVGVAFLDLDGFKSINDHHGHAAGDALLSAIAARLPSALRATDTVGRVGGDEFVIVCPDADETALREVVERAARAVERVATEHVAILPDQPPITFSAGVCAARGPDDPEQVLAAADQAMYRAKRVRGSSLACVDHDAVVALDR